jgi:hypothetical protein
VVGATVQVPDPSAAFARTSWGTSVKSTKNVITAETKIITCV